MLATKDLTLRSEMAVEIVKSQEVALILALAKDSKCPKAGFEAMAVSSEASVRLAAAISRKTSVTTLRILLKDRSSRVRDAASSNKALKGRVPSKSRSYSEAAALLELEGNFGIESVEAAIAKLCKASIFSEAVLLRVLELKSKNSIDSELLAAFVNLSPNPKDILRWVDKLPLDTVADLVVVGTNRGYSLSGKAVHKHLIAALTGPGLLGLAKSSSPKARYLAARDSRTQLTTLRKLITDRYFIISAAAALNPTTTISVAKEYIVRCGVDDKAAVKLISNWGEELRSELLRRGDADLLISCIAEPKSVLTLALGEIGYVLTVLSESNDEYLRECVAAHPDCPEKVLAKLMFDTCRDTREAAMRHENAQPMDLIAASMKFEIEWDCLVKLTDVELLQLDAGCLLNLIGGDDNNWFYGSSRRSAFINRCKSAVAGAVAESGVVSNGGLGILIKLAVGFHGSFNDLLAACKTLN